MATEAEIARLRLMIAEPDAEKYTDEALAVVIDESSDLNKAAFTIWSQKAASAAELVDISEGGSSRKLGDVYEQALTMAKFYSEQTPGGTDPDAPRYPRLSKLRRA